MADDRLTDANRVWGLRTATVAVGMLLAFTATPGVAAEPLSFYGFDEASHTSEATAGMEAIFAGRLFHAGIPVSTARMLLRAMAGSGNNLGYDPESDEGRFYAFGRFPSPPGRTVGADSGFGLGESVLERNGVELVSFNCFTCHAGVVNGQVVAGLGNNHINQSDPKHARTRGDNFGPYAVWRFGRNWKTRPARG